MSSKAARTQVTPSCGSSPGTILSSLIIFLIITTWGDTTGISWGKPRSTAMHPTKHKTTTASEEASGPQC